MESSFQFARKFQDFPCSWLPRFVRSFFVFVFLSIPVTIISHFNNLKNNILGRTVTSVSEEKTLNPRLTKPREDFIKIMNGLGLPYPKKIGKIFLNILIWGFFIWNTYEIKYQIMHSGHTVSQARGELVSLSKCLLQKFDKFQRPSRQKLGVIFIQFDVFLFGIHWRSSTKWCTRGANGLTGLKWTCLVVQMSTSKIWWIFNTK